MKFFLLISLCLMTHMVRAQDSWKVMLNDKTLLSASAENEEKNVVVIKAADLKKKKDFSITYAERPKKEQWERSFIITNGNDQELLHQTGSRLKLKDAALQTFFKKSSTLRFYTISLPKDPAKRAVVRVRRVHLCTLKLN